MSGGYYNYIQHADSIDELIDKRDNVEEMLHDLQNRGKEFSIPASETKKVLDMIDQVISLQRQVINPSLTKLWRSIDYSECMDGDENDVFTSLKEYCEHNK